jgi:GTP-binding protein
VFPISGATGQGVDALLDAVLGYLPDRTATETKGSEVEDAEEGAASDWSPL